MAVAKKTKKILTPEEEIQVRFEKTSNLYLNSKLKPCMDACAVALENSPEHTGFLNLLALAHWRKGDLKSMLKFANEVLALDADDMTANKLLAIAYSQTNGKEQEALKLFGVCIEKDPENCELLRYRALTYVRLEDLQGLPPKVKEKYMMKADEDLQTIMRVVGENEEESDFLRLYNRSFAQLYMLKYMNAKNDAERAIELFETNTEASLKDRNVLKEIKTHLKKSSSEMKKQ
jgi:tetratricopeptide (TPR) repeat protein